MGGNSSKHEASPTPPPPPPSPLFDKPWRDIYWDLNQQALDCVRKYKPSIEGQQLRILLHGDVGVGKSSFINSVQSVLRGRMCVEALVDNKATVCFTKGYTTYTIQKGGPGSFYPFMFNDIMGLSTNKGILVDDIILALKGHVKEGYKFNPESKLSEGDQFYNKSPSDNDKVHVLVCVVPADTIPLMKDEVIKKIKEIRINASRLGIPQVAVITKVDEACPEVKKDLRNVYRSKCIKQRMEQFSANVGIPMNCIFPLRNYHQEINFNNNVDSLILSVLKSIINFGDDFIDRNLQKVHS
ncbi:interferon-induced protein 44-like isoform X2 [Betta splendens]|nr:interferon-induced protein 44-like isoform X2 [Betta splendens]